jgi:hypothetical protein
MSDKRKETEIEWREPIDLHAISQLIGATSDFRAGARSYLDDIEGMAIQLLVSSDDLPEGELTSLRVASDALRPAFEELASTFSESYRERGHQMLWALMKATVDIVHANHNSGLRMRADDEEAEREGWASDHVARFDMAVLDVAERKGRNISKSKEFALAVAPGVKEQLGRDKPPGKEKVWASVDRLRAEGFAHFAVTITSEQMRAARDLLRWEQKVLAEATGVPLRAIKRLEKISGALKAHASTVDKIVKAIDAAGVEFTNERPSVRWKAKQDLSTATRN